MRLKREAKQRKTLILAGFVLVLAGALAFQHTRVARYLDHKVLDLQFGLLRYVSPKRLEPDVVIVGIDEETFKGFREPLALWHPYLGKFLEAMALARPRVVGLDVVLPDRSYDFLFSGYDRPLLAGLLKLRRAAPVFLAQTVDEKGNLRPIFAPIVSIAGRESVGLALVKADMDGTVRRYGSVLKTLQGPLATLVGRMTGHPGENAEEGIINYALGEMYRYIPLQQVVAWYDAGETGPLMRACAGRPVLLGGVLPFDDRHRAPVPLAAWEPKNRRIPGVLIHAQALRSLLSDEGLIQTVSPLFISALIVLASLLWWLGARPLWGAPLLMVLTGLLWGFSTSSLSSGSYWPVVAVTFSGCLGLLGRMGLEGALAFREKRWLRHSFGRYVSPEVLRAILEGKIRPEIGGERRRVCVLFSDIRGFTQRSESQTPEETISLLNLYFEEMTTAIHSHGGTIDKFMGDGLMAFFGAPGRRENPSQDAFDAGQEMLARLERLNETLKARKVRPVEIGVGLHAGEVVVGHMGSEQRHEYTVIGDTVNVASRLEGLTKDLGYFIVCSAQVAGALNTAVELEPLGEQPIKGHAPVEVFGWRPE